MTPQRLALRATVCALVTVVATAGPAMAGHLTGYDSVDDREIRYENRTKYDKTFAHARAEWNAVGSVDSKGDTATTIADLEIKDVKNSTASWPGRYTNRPGRIDLIELETTYMDSTTAAKMKNVMIHEMGHALGLDDHSSASWDAIMYETVRGWTTVHDHDEADYGKLW